MIRNGSKQRCGSYERSLIYSGLRGVGKTVLLIELDVLATEAGWATTDVQEVGSQPDFRVTFARMAARVLRELSRRHRVKERVERALGVVKAFSVAVPGAVTLKLDVEAASGVADSGDHEQDLTDLVREIGEVAQATNSVALFLKPYADRLFQYHELGRLAAPAARTALVAPAATRGIDCEEDAARHVVAQSAGYPYFLQEFGRELWNHVEDSPVTAGDVEEVREIVSDSLARNFFGTRFQLGTDVEQRYLAAMASLGDPPYRTAAVAEAYGARDQRGVSVHRESLIGKGLIWSPRRGQLDFSVPLFAEYLRDNHPIASFDEG